MKKKILLLISMLLMFLVVGGMHPKKVEATYYGKRVQYTTQPALRGTWYYKDLTRSAKGYKIYRLRITAHKINSCHLYKRYSGPVNDFLYWSAGKQRRAMTTTKYWLAARTLKYKGKKMLNTLGWFQSSGDGTYYIPARKHVNGRYVKAIRIAGGAYVETISWAVKSKNLARQIPMPSLW